MRHLYEPAAYEAGSLDGCWWAGTAADPGPWERLGGSGRVDVAIIGAGYAGLSAALELASAGARVAVLDRHRPGWGASGRNGGFCCVGGAKLGRTALIRRYGETAEAQWRRTEAAAIAHVEATAAAHAIDFDRQASGEMVLAHSARALAGLSAQAPALAAAYGVAPELLDREGLAARGLAAQVHGGLYLPLGFALNPRKYVLGLAAAAVRAGVRIFADSPVTGLAASTGGYRLDTPGGSLTAGRVILATNGYAAEDGPGGLAGAILPVQSSILVTRPLAPHEIAAQGWSSDLMAYDARHLLHYFRLLPDRRFLFGMRGGIRWTPATHAAIRAQMRRDLAALFPAWAAIPDGHFWSGLACMTARLHPFVGPVPGLPGVWAAFGWHGNGVAMASLCGREVARMALGRTHDLPDFLSLPPRRFPLGRYRRLLLRAAYTGYALADRL